MMLNLGITKVWREPYRGWRMRFRCGCEVRVARRTGEPTLYPCRPYLVGARHGS